MKQLHHLCHELHLNLPSWACFHVQGPSGGATPLLILKRRVKKMIEEEDLSHPLTDEHITERLQSEGIQVTRRTVAKYREDMRIPSTHQRRIRK